MEMSKLHNYEQFAFEMELFKKRLERENNEVNLLTREFCQFITTSRWIDIGLNAQVEVSNAYGARDARVDKVRTDYMKYKIWLNSITVEPHTNEEFRLCLREVKVVFDNFYSPIIEEIGDSNMETAQEPERVLNLYAFLNQHKFTAFIANKRYNPDAIKRLLIEVPQRYFAPYSLALLHHVGFITRLKVIFRTNTNLYSNLAKALSRPQRYISGNLRVLDSDNTNENEKDYPAKTFLPEIIRALPR